MKKETFNSRYLAHTLVAPKARFASWLNKDLLVEIICSLLIILFIYAALSKLADYNRFTVQLSKSPFITSFSGFVAWSIPTVEIAISLFLAIKKTRLIGLYASFFMMNLFTAYLIIMLNFSYYIPCSCGGVLEYLSWEQHVFFNIFFIALSATGAIIQHKNIYA